jgi:hypothetical protein
LETLDGWALLLAPVAGVVVLPIAWALANNSERLRRSRHLAASVAMSVGGLIVAHWVGWWFSFDTVQGEPAAAAVRPLGASNRRRDRTN